MKIKTKTEIKNVVMLFFIALFIFSFMITAKDFINFQEITSKQYKTPWYDNSVMKEPYTTVRLALADKSNVKEYWTKNAIGSENWYVREVKVGETEFWTIIERVELN